MFSLLSLYQTPVRKSRKISQINHLIFVKNGMISSMSHLISIPPMDFPVLNQRDNRAKRLLEDLFLDLPILNKRDIREKRCSWKIPFLDPPLF
jgi:hypothetical protein